MRELGYDGMSEDDEFLIVRDPSTDEQFRVRLDPGTLQRRADVPSSSTGSETAMNPITLSPRDIQTRIRRGESAQQVADASGMPLERIEAFAGPVVAEREYMVQQARKTSLRRKHVTGAGLTLGSVVDATLLDAGSQPDDATWDAFRREDGRWSVLVTPPGSEQTSTFVFDTASRYVIASDDSAVELVGDLALPDTADMAIADVVRRPDAPAADVPDASVDAPTPTGREDTARLEVEQAELEYTDAQGNLLDDLLPPDIAAAEALLDAAESPRSGVSSLKDARDRRAQEALARAEAEAQVEKTEGTPQPGDEPETLEDSIDRDVAVPDTAGPRKKRNERRRVPSWDEIMFGGKDD